MRSALYYPHTTIRSERLVKRALLLWDELEYIVPAIGHGVHHGSRNIDRAMELIGRPRVPSNSEKRETDTLVRRLIDQGLPPQFYWSADRGIASDYEMYETKLLGKTWEALQHSSLAGAMPHNSRFAMNEATGLMLMSILADCCAGKTRARVTDRGPAYAILAGLLGQNVDVKAPELRSPHEELVQISLETINPELLSIERLLEFRQREDQGQCDLRHRYLARLEDYVRRLATEGGRESDAQEIKRQFADDMRGDLADLKAELGFNRRAALLSSGIVVTALALADSLAARIFHVPVVLAGTLTAAGLPAALMAVAAGGNNYFRGRREIMQRHPMAYFYELRPGGT